MENNTRLAVAALAVLSQPPPIHQNLALAGIPLQHSLLANRSQVLEACCTAADTVPSIQDSPRPEQGGDRITEAFLHRLGPWECRWRFR
jgi:hypothetical protein